ncbi:MAG: hypothetical protein IKK57_03835 [Clostridia bacterium]|nr:hypothetical protein [Clostridia bacterium]
MSKYITLLLAVCLCCAALTGFGGPALAELPLVYPAETVIGVMQLTQTQRELAAFLYQPVLAGEETITLPDDTRYDDVGPALQSLMLNYPELFHLGRTYTITYWQNEPDVAVSVRPSYRMDARTAEDLRQQLYEAALYLVAQDGTAVGLHDALLQRVTYGGADDMRHTAVGALLYGTATCEGYAQALSLLYRMAGIPCGVITGTAVSGFTGQTESHSWNVMNLGGFSLIDATWNDQEGAGLNTYWYFGLSTQQMAADHTPDRDMEVPACTEHAGWHLRMGRCAQTQEDVFRALQALVVNGTPLNLRITDAALYREISGDIGALLDAYNTWAPEKCGFYGRYSYLLGDAQQCIIIRWTE